MIHEDPSKAHYVDGDVADLLDQIDREDARGWGPFANTLVVLFSDHGPRMGRARLSLQVIDLDISKTPFHLQK